MNDPLSIRRLYGRSKGRPLRTGQSALVEELLPALSVPEEGPLDSVTLFGDDRPLHFEIGFGGGEHLAYRADLLPDHGFIGAEPFLNGVATALGHIRDRHLTNVRDFHWLAESADDFLTRPGGWPETRYEAKARREGREVWYFRYRRC